MSRTQSALPADSILVADGGFAAHWTGLLYDTKIAGRHFIPDRGLASIGYGLPGGIGAALAAPKTPVVAITGDGGFNMMLGELETARRAGDRSDDCRRQQRRLRLCEGVAARDVPRPLPILRPRRNGLCRDRSSHGMQRDSRRGPGQARRCAGNGVGRARPARRCSTSLSRATPRRMLPAVDNRTVEVKQGDRVAS